MPVARMTLVSGHSSCDAIFQGRISWTYSGALCNSLSICMLLQIKLNAIQAMTFQETPSATTAVVSVYIIHNICVHYAA